MLKLKVGLIFLFLFFNYISAQNYELEKLEQLFERISSFINASNEVDQIESFILNPINIKEVSERKLAEIPGISYDLASRIKQLVRNNPDMQLNLLRDSLNLSNDIFYLLQTTMNFDGVLTKNIKKKNKVAFRARYQPLLNSIKGFEDGKFLGSPYDSYLRFRGNINGINAGLLLSKDIGEKRLTEFLAGYLNFNFLGVNVLLGNFTIEAGMGNILWNQFSFGKGAETIYPAISFKSKINGYASSTEAGFFRGLASEFNVMLSDDLIIKNTLWLSHRDLSGTLNNSNDTVTSIYTSGLFRTESEISKKNILDENIYGFKSELFGKNIITGLIGFFYNYDKFINSESRAVFYGKSGYLGSVYYLFKLGRTNFTGELSLDNRNEYAIKTTISNSYDNIDLAINFRYFSENFRSPYGFNFGESPEVNNETGLYTGIKWKVAKRLLVSSYFDLFKTIARSFFIPFQKRGEDFFFQTDWKIDLESNLRLRFNFEGKTDNITDDKGNKFYPRKTKYSSRIDYQRSFDEIIIIKLRADFNSVSFENVKPDENGFASSLELTYKPIRDIMLQSRVTYFNTDSYESAIWQFESPVIGYMYSQLLYGSGWRAYLGFRYQLSDFLNFSCRFSITSKNNVTNLGSGLNQILDYQDKRIIFQFDLNF